MYLDETLLGSIHVHYLCYRTDFLSTEHKIVSYMLARRLLQAWTHAALGVLCCVHTYL